MIHAAMQALLSGLQHYIMRTSLRRCIGIDSQHKMAHLQQTPHGAL